MINLEQAKQMLLDMYAHDERNDFSASLDDFSFEELVESDNPHIYVALLMIEHDGDKEKVLEELSKIE